jgi:hypothetical protein
MPRFALLLLLATVASCQSTEQPTEDLSVLCPCLTYQIATVNGHGMPYTPGDTAYNPNALMDDGLTFYSDGSVDDVSTIRVVERGSASIITNRITGYYTADPPIVTVYWPHVGMGTYVISGPDSLSRYFDVVKENWVYTRKK